MSRSEFIRRFESSEELTEALVYAEMEPWYSSPSFFWLSSIYLLLVNMGREDDDLLELEDVLPGAEETGNEEDDMARIGAKLKGLGSALRIYNG